MKSSKRKHCTTAGEAGEAISRFAAIPSELKARRQWVGFRIIPMPKGKPKKIPFMAAAPTRKAKSTDPSTWNTFDMAVQGLAKGAFRAIGYAMAGDVVGIDLDGERWVTEAGELSEEAQAIVERCASYAEYSISGRGIHILLHGKLPRGRNEAGVEVYSQKRFFVMTGRKLPNAPATINENQAALDWFLARYFDYPDEQRDAEHDIDLSADSENSAISADSAISVNTLIESTQPSKPGERNARLYDLARGLKLNCRIPSAAEAKAAVRKWHRRALPNIGTPSFDETWADFCRGWETGVVPLGAAVVDDAMQKARTSAPAAALNYDTPAVRLLVGLCWHLASLHPQHRFFLSTHLAGELLGVSAMTVWKWLRMLCTDGVLELAERGNEHRATRYRWIGPDGPTKVTESGA